MEAKELTFEELLKLVSSGKATALQKIKFSELLAKSAEQEAEQEKQNKVVEIDNFIKQQGLTVEEYLKFKKPAPSTEILWSWTDDSGKVHNKIKGQRGTWSSASIVKENLSKKEALEIAKTDEAKAFINKLYKEK